MASITSWQRLEPRTRSDDMVAGLEARVHDPAWLLARQWQTGEFQGEDAGSPVRAQVAARVSTLSRFRAGDAGPLSWYDPATAPLEPLVEAEPRGAGDLVGLAADAGLQLVRLLRAAGADAAIATYLQDHPLPQLQPAERAQAPPRLTARLDLMSGRVPDGLAAAVRLRQELDASGGQKLPAELGGEPAIPVAEALLAWVDEHAGAATADSSWLGGRLEYSFAVAAPDEGGTEIVLHADEYLGGRLDWFSCDAEAGASLGAAGDGPPEQWGRDVIPTGVAYPGMPAARFWQFEPAAVHFGGVAAGPEDLSRMVLTEFAMLYGNDFFMVPLELPVGSLTRILGLVVTDTFGRRTVIDSAATVDSRAPGERFRIFGPDGAEDLFFLAPALAPSLDGELLEDVQLARDEMANLAWSIERTVEAPWGLPLDRFEAHKGERRAAGHEQPAPPAPLSTAGPELVYRLATDVPPNWFPLMPRQTGTDAIELEVARVSGSATTPASRMLALGARISEEEVPRSGVRLTRRRQLARWVDGSTHLWTGRAKSAGRGETSSGLRFDVVEPRS
jgi:hypothetical protein